MFTKLIYFRPDKRFVKNELLDNKYSCVIQDELNKAESSITVPRYLTLIQYFSNPKIHRKKKKSCPEFLEKICFHLVGSPQVPQLDQCISKVEFVDRIEFHGHIGFEEPVFAAIGQLQELKKVSFFLSPCKQEEFKKADDENRENQAIPLIINRSVTCLKIVVDKFCLDAECQNCKAINISSTKEVLESMIIQILNRSKEQFPNIKRLTLDIPNWGRLKSAVDDIKENMKSLKPTTVTVKNDRIIVQKTSDIPVPTPIPEPEPAEKIPSPEKIPPADLPEVPATAQERMSPFPELISSVSTPATQNQTKQAWSRSSPKSKPNLAEVLKDTSNGTSSGEDQVPLNQLSADGQPCLGLVDMSKLLGSMLGIPSSASLGCPASSTSGQSQSSTSTKLPLSNQNPNSANIMANPNSIPKSSTTEVAISYAAAAASNNKLALGSTRHLRGTGNDNHHHQNNKSSNGSSIGNGEASKRTFFFEGASKPPPLIIAESSKRSNHSHSHSHHHMNANPSISIADLGKPVFNGATTASSTRHIKA